MLGGAWLVVRAAVVVAVAGSNRTRIATAGSRGHRRCAASVGRADQLGRLRRLASHRVAPHGLAARAAVSCRVAACRLGAVSRGGMPVGVM